MRTRRYVSIDASAALALPGVVAVLAAKEIRSIVATDRLVVALPDRTYRQQRDRSILRGLKPFMSAKP